MNEFYLQPLLWVWSSQQIDLFSIYTIIIPLQETGPFAEKPPYSVFFGQTCLFSFSFLSLYHPLPPKFFTKENIFAFLVVYISFQFSPPSQLLPFNINSRFGASGHYYYHISQPIFYLAINHSNPFAIPSHFIYTTTHLIAYFGVMQVIFMFAASASTIFSLTISHFELPFWTSLYKFHSLECSSFTCYRPLYLACPPSPQPLLFLS